MYFIKACLEIYHSIHKYFVVSSLNPRPPSNHFLYDQTENKKSEGDKLFCIYIKHCSGVYTLKNVAI